MLPWPPRGVAEAVKTEPSSPMRRPCIRPQVGSIDEAAHLRTDVSEARRRARHDCIAMGEFCRWRHGRGLIRLLRARGDLGRHRFRDSLQIDHGTGSAARDRPRHGLDVADEAL